MGDEVIERLEIMKECVNCGRVVYESFATGTEFEKILEGVI